MPGLRAGRTRRRLVRKSVRMNAFRQARRRRGAMYKRSSQGYLSITRKLPEIAITNTGVGTAALTDPTGSCVSITNLGLSLGASANLYDIAFSMKFRLDQLINSGDITTLCDKYKIKSVYVKAYYNNTNSSTGTLGGMPFLQYITDKDDASVPTSVNQLREKMGLKSKTFRNGSYIGIVCRPTPTRNVYATGVLSGYEIPAKSLWLDCNSPNVEHYGVKGILSQVYLPAPAAAQAMLKFDIQVNLVGKDFQ